MTTAINTRMLNDNQYTNILLLVRIIKLKARPFTNDDPFLDPCVNNMSLFVGEKTVKVFKNTCGIYSHLSEAMRYKSYVDKQSI